MKTQYVIKNRANSDRNYAGYYNDKEHLFQYGPYNQFKYDAPMPKGTKIPPYARRFGSVHEAKEFIEEMHVHGNPVVVRVKPRSLKPIKKLSEKNIHIALNRLGKTVEEVAENLERWGCHKTPGLWSENCPVSTYLKKVFEGRKFSTAASCTNAYSEEPCRADQKLLTVEGFEESHPAVSQFINAFDDRKFPQLMKAG